MALITAAEAKVLIPALSGTASDTDLDTLITRADQALAAWLGWPPASAGGAPTLEDTSHTLYSAPDWVQEGGRLLQLPVAPLASITSVHEDEDWGYGSATEVTENTDFVADLGAGRLWILPTGTHGAWSQNHRAIKVIAVAGYATVPEWLKQATAMTVHHWWRLRREQGHTNVSQGGTSTGLRPETLPDAVKELVQPYRRAWVYL